jgi:hypothetical protein
MPFPQLGTGLSFSALAGLAWEVPRSSPDAHLALTHEGGHCINHLFHQASHYRDVTHHVSVLLSTGSLSCLLCVQPHSSEHVIIPV